MLLRLVLRKKIYINLIVSVALVISLIATPLWISEYVATSHLKINLNKALVDSKMTIQLTNFNREYQLKNDILNLSFVEDVKIVEMRDEKSIILSFNEIVINPIYNRTSPILITNFDPNEWINDVNFTIGNVPNNDDEVSISIEFAKKYGIDVGDTIEIQSHWGNFNKTYKVAGIFNLSGLLKKIIYKEDLIQLDVPLRVKNETSKYLGVFLFTRDEVISGSGLSSVYSAFPNFFIWINRELITNPWNPSDIFKQLKSFDNEILLQATKYTPLVTIQYYNYLKMVVDSYARWPSAFRIQLTYAILPGIMVGAFLAVIVGWTYVNRRMHEIALFRIRGVNNKQLLLLITYEFLIVSILGSVLGFALSLMLVYLSSAILFQDYLAYCNLTLIIAKSALNYFNLSLIYGIVFSFLSVIPATAQAFKMTILEGLSQYIEKIEKEPKPIYSFLAIGLGLYTVIESLYGLYVLKNIALKFMASNTALTQVIGILIFIADVIAIGAGPFALAYGLSRVIAYYASKLHGFIENILGLMSSSFASIAIKHFSRRPSRTARLIFVTALIMSFMLTAGVNVSTNINEIDSLVKIVVGSKYRIDVFSGPNNPMFWENNISSEIHELNPELNVIIAYYMYKPIRLDLPYARIIAIDPSYFEHSFIDQSILHDVRLQTIVNAFNSEKVAILGISAKEEYGLHVGENITFRFSYMGELEKITFKVIGFMDFLPGLLNDIYAAQKEDQLIIVVNKNFILNYLQSPYRVLLHTTANVNDEALIRDLSSIFLKYSIYVHIYSFKLMRNYALRESISGIMINIYRAEFLQLALITAFSIYVILVSEYIERRREMALMLSRGVSKKQLYSIAKTESIIIILAAFFTSIVISWGFAYPLLEMISYGLYGAFKSLPGHGVVLSLDVLSYLVVEAAVVYLSALIAMKIALKLDLPKEIRIHH